MKNLCRRLVPICTLAMAIVFIFPCYSFAKATPYGSFDVFAPTAKLKGWHDVLYGTGDQAKKLDGTYAFVSGLGSYIQSQDFSSTTYNNYWAPYSNRSAFPPDGATILGVSLIAVVRAQVTKPFTLSIVYGRDWDGDSWSMYMLTSSMFYATTTDQVYSYNITADLIAEGAITAWNATMLKSTSSDEWFYVQLMSWADTPGHILYVDYVGLSYIWSYPSGGGGGDGEPGIFTTPDVIGLMGMTGFIGMIGVPAASIWFFRRDGGSKIMIGVSALVAFTVCLGFFLASINGG